MYKRRLAALVMALSLTACLRALLPLDTLRFDTASTTVVLAADYNPGVPALDSQTTGQPKNIPLLRVWSDGLVFLDAWVPDHIACQSWTGRLSAAQIQAALDLLSRQGYLEGWTPEPADGPNPAGFFMALSVHLSDRSIENGSGDTKWPLYVALVRQLQPALQPLTLGPNADPRLTRLKDEFQGCATPTLP